MDGYYLGQSGHLAIVQSVGADESRVALAAWVLTFQAMLRHLYRTLLRPHIRDQQTITAAPEEIQ